MARRHQFLTIGFLLGSLEWGLIPHTKQGFFCRDPTLSFPFHGDTVSMTALLVISTIGPLIVILVVEALRESSFSQVRYRIVWQLYKEYLVVISMVLLITEAAKVVFGEHRPHFMTTCVPDMGVDCANGDYVTEFTCTSADFSQWLVTDSSRSFPSGHASISVFAALYSSIVIHWRMPTRHTGQLFKPFFISVCLVWGVLCSLSRITDKRHHWWDVLAGTSLGIAGAFYALYVLRNNLGITTEKEKPPRTSPSTTTLLDERNKDAVSAAI